MAGKINVIACGGAGINVADKVISMVSELGDGFAGFQRKLRARLLAHEELSVSQQ